MKTIGLVGGIASGKSAVASVLVDLGGILLNADKAGHEVLCDSAVRSQIVARFGEDLLDASGEIQRPKLAKIVFAADGAEHRIWLEQLTHPRIAKKLEALLEAARTALFRAAILDAALLFEAKWDHVCDLVIFVAAPTAVRRARAKLRGWSEAEFRDREATQMALDEKKQRCGYVIDNSGDLASTRQQVEEFWRLYVGPTDH